MNRAALHYLLWRRASAMGALRINQTEMAKEFSMSKFSLNRVIRRMETEGRIVKLAGATGGTNSHTYQITDPADFVELDA